VQDPPSDGTPGTPGACSAFDTILCLSTTKWVHLHSGDAGLLCLFHRMHAALRPQGRLLLEPQPWSSYRKAAGVAPHVLRNYGRIQVKPSSFREVLLHQVGFVSCEDISTTDTLQPGAPVGFAQGARGGSKRPLLLWSQGGVSTDQRGCFDASMGARVTFLAVSHGRLYSPTSAMPPQPPLLIT
jgi:7SK snRNA methylphosphate capping enzyme